MVMRGGRIAVLDDQGTWAGSGPLGSGQTDGPADAMCEFDVSVRGVRTGCSSYQTCVGDREVPLSVEDPDSLSYGLTLTFAMGIKLNGLF